MPDGKDVLSVWWVGRWVGQHNLRRGGGHIIMCLQQGIGAAIGLGQAEGSGTTPEEVEETSSACLPTEHGRGECRRGSDWVSLEADGSNIGLGYRG